ncbi:MAG: undecaprenyl-diphosphate phosphatase [Ignavibacteriales bacterium]|nr:undecaprenyl-diphosphate phosphatase [Ignavibacteriales bacterium]
MSVINAVLLAILQGFTEFLPVSSSGHLVLVQELLNLHDPQMIIFDVFVHFGTLISVVFVFWKDLLEILRSFVKALSAVKLKKDYEKTEHFLLGVAIIIGSIPAGIIGLLYRHQIEAAFTDPKLVAMNLVITGLILFLTRLSKPIQGKKVGLVAAFIIGIAQAVAILPGISRSGSTMSTALYLKISPMLAARFSFLLSVPVIAGAALLEGHKLFKYGNTLGTMPLVVGTMVSAIAGYFAIKVLLKIMEKGKFSWFSVYCLAIGILGILFI